MANRRFRNWAILFVLFVIFVVWGTYYNNDCRALTPPIPRKTLRNSVELQDLYSTLFNSNGPCPAIWRDILPPDRDQVPNDAPEFPIAFTVVAHKEFARLARLLRMIYRPQNTYCIHIDKRSSQQFRTAVENLASCLGENVVLIPKEESTEVKWGDANVFEPQLVCARNLLRKNAEWRYMVNCVGQEFPLRTNREMVAALKALNGSNLIEIMDNLLHWRLGGNTPPFQVIIFISCAFLNI